MADVSALIADQARRILMLELQNDELREKVEVLETTASTLQELLEQALNVNDSESGDEQPEVIAVVKPWPVIANTTRGVEPHSGVYLQSSPLPAAMAPNTFAATPTMNASTSVANPFPTVASDAVYPSSTSSEDADNGFPLASELLPAQRSKALYDASETGNLDLVLELCALGANVNYRRNRNSPLHKAATGGYADIVFVLIQNGARLNVRDTNDETPLHLAASYGYRLCVEKLIEAGARVNLKRYDGSTPLHLAADTGTYSCVRSLLIAGADRTIRNTKYELPEDLAHTTGIKSLLLNE